MAQQTLKQFLIEIKTKMDTAGTTRAKQEMDAMGASVKNLITKFAGPAGIAAALIGAGKAMQSMINDTIKAADELDGLVKKLGVSAEALQELGFASEQAGGSVEGFYQAIKFLSRNMYDALVNSTGEAAETFEYLGVSVTDSAGQLRKAEDVFMELLDVIPTAGNDTEQLGVAMKIMGRSAADVMPMFKGGAAAVAQMREDLRKTGAVISGEEVKKYDELADKMTIIAKQVDGAKRAFSREFIPVLEEGIPIVMEMAKNMSAVAKAAGQAVVEYIKAAQSIGVFLGTVMDPATLGEKLFGGKQGGGKGGAFLGRFTSDLNDALKQFRLPGDESTAKPGPGRITRLTPEQREAQEKAAKEAEKRAAEALQKAIDRETMILEKREELRMEDGIALDEINAEIQEAQNQRNIAQAALMQSRIDQEVRLRDEAYAEAQRQAAEYEALQEQNLANLDTIQEKGLEALRQANIEAATIRRQQREAEQAERAQLLELAKADAQKAQELANEVASAAIQVGDRIAQATRVLFDPDMTAAEKWRTLLTEIAKSIGMFVVEFGIKMAALAAIAYATAGLTGIPPGEVMRAGLTMMTGAPAVGGGGMGASGGQGGFIGLLAGQATQALGINRGGAQVVTNNYNVQGNIWAENQLMAATQQAANARDVSKLAFQY